MQRTNVTLAAVLAVQVVLAGVTWATSRSSSSDAPVGTRPAFGDLTAGDVSLLSVVEPAKDGGEPTRVELAREGEGWVLASAGGYPAKSDKVDEVLDKLLALRIATPIASHAINHNALGVGERDYGRKVKVGGDGAEREVVLGRGAGSSVHVRFEGDDDVYRSRGLSVWAVPSGARSYVEPSYVEVAEDKLERISVSNEHGTLSLAREGDGWIVAEMPPGAELDEPKVKAFVRALARVNLSEPVGKTVSAEQRLDGSTAVTLSWVSEDDEPRTTRYVVGAAADDQSFYVKADDNDFIVTVAKFGVEQARTKSVEDLIKKTDA